MEGPFRIFKFGGASVKDAAGIKNVVHLVHQESQALGRIVIVVSAMGKTTNALEAIVQAAGRGDDFHPQIESLLAAHVAAAEAALSDGSTVKERLQNIGQNLVVQAERARELPFDEAYDQIVSLGEVLSSQILASALDEELPSVSLLDARKLIKTDTNFRSPVVEQPLTQQLIRQALTLNTTKVLVVQGFIGSDELGRTTTLGREGSDYTAALFGQALQAESVTVWKDVPGVLNADPKRLPTASLISALSYAEAAEMTYYGATVIHPKTLKPLSDAGIPLYVKSFVRPSEPGTFIGPHANQAASNVMLYLDKVALITCQTRNLQFVTELHVAKVMQAAFQSGLQVLMVQNSALEMQLAVPQDFQRAAHLAELLDKEYQVKSEYSLALVTFLRAEQSFIDQNLINKRVLIRQQNDKATRALIHV